MKRRWGLIIASLLTALTATFALACGEGDGNGEDNGGVTNVEQTPLKLATPVVVVNGNTATWEAVEGASEYEYSLDGGITVIKTTALSVDTQGKEIIVRAVGDGVNTRHSSWSDEATQGGTTMPDQGGDNTQGGDDNTQGGTTTPDQGGGDNTQGGGSTDNENQGDDNTQEHTCEDVDKNHVCDGCDKPMGEHEAAQGMHDCDYCGEKVSSCIDNDNNHACDICGEAVSSCLDTDKNHVCDICGEAVGKPGDDTKGDVMFTGADKTTVKSPSNDVAIESVTVPITGMRVSTTADWSTVYVTLTKDGAPLTQADFSEYRYLDVKIYAEQAGATLLLLNQPVGTLKQGENTIRVMTWDVLMQMTDSASVYDFETGETYFQIWGSGHTLIFEEIIGVKEEKIKVPNGTVDKKDSSTVINACEGNSETNPIAWYCGTNGQVSEDTSIVKQGRSSYKVVANANNYITLSMRHQDTSPLTQEELRSFDYLCLDVYNAETGDINLFMYNDLAATLAPGWNTVKIPSEKVKAQIEESENAYRQNGGGVLQYDSSHFYFVVYAAATLYFDNVGGVNERAVDLGNVFILGDSYSTFEEYIPYVSDAAWYRKTPAFVTDVDKVTETWWGQLLNETDSSLLVNASYSGTTMCNVGYNNQDSTATSFTTRLQKYIDDGYFAKNQVDTFFVFGGTNDVWANADNKRDVGTVKYAEWTKEDLGQIIPAFCYLLNQIKTQVKPTRLVFVLNDELALWDTNIVEGYKTACAYYGVDLVELSGVSKQSGHPDEVGMTKIKDQIIAYCKNKNS